MRLLQVEMIFIAAAISGTGAFGQETPSRTWTQSIFLDFVDGSFSDGGANTYVAADGTIRLIHLWDLNGDGNFDLPITSPQDYSEIVPLYIYTADESGYSSDRRIELPTEGAMCAAAADLNQDGWPDLIVGNNFNGDRTDLNSYIYWNGPNGFDAGHPTLLPTQSARGVAIADLNGDGFEDIVFANRGNTYHMAVDSFQKSYIYWGSPQGYSEQQRSILETVYCIDVKIADANGDGFLDIVFANEGNTDSDGGAVIYFGNARGEYDSGRRTCLPGRNSTAVLVTELNGDSCPEIVLVNRYKKKLDMSDRGAVEDSQAYPSYIYWGSKDGYDVNCRAELQTVEGIQAAAGDLNQDGRPDLIFANGTGGVSYIYWNTPDGFFPYKRTSIPTPASAYGVLAEDLNHDGRPDLVFALYANATSWDNESRIYWNGPEGFAADRRTGLPTHGAMKVLSADFNQDGRNDLVFVNKLEGVLDTTETPARIYWGDNHGGFSPQRYLALMQTNKDQFLAADFNGDDEMDILYSGVGSPSKLFWGGNEGLSSGRYSLVPHTQADVSARTADFNRDGYLDLLFNGGNLVYGQINGFSPSNRCNLGIRSNYFCIADLNKDGWIDGVFPVADEKLMILWNSPNGFDVKNSVVLPTRTCSMAEIADLNRDSYLDIIAVNQYDKHKPAGAGEILVFQSNPHTESYVYWGGPDGYLPDRRTELPTVGGIDAAAADFNNDGLLDVIFTNYHAGTHRREPAYLYWNSPEGFRADSRTLVPADAGCGVFAADVNSDGYQDLFIANHLLKGNQRSCVSVDYGGKDGFSPERRVKLPALGPHYFSYVDIGHIYDRSDRYEYISVPFDAGGPVKWQRIRWEAQTPFRTRVEFQIRTAATCDQLTVSPWKGPEGPERYYRDSGTSLPAIPPDHCRIQYKAVLVSPNSVNTPVLHSVSIDYILSGATGMKNSHTTFTLQNKDSVR